MNLLMIGGKRNAPGCGLVARVRLPLALVLKILSYLLDYCRTLRRICACLSG